MAHVRTVAGMRHCSRCKFKHDRWCGFWEELRRDVCVVDCSEKFVRECCDEGILETDGHSDIIVADTPAFMQKWQVFFAKDKVHAKRDLWLG